MSNLNELLELGLYRDSDYVLAPHILSSEFPEADQPAIARTIEAQLRMASYVHNFADSLDLFEFCEKRISVLNSFLDENVTSRPARNAIARLARWKIAAAQDIVLCIYHFSKDRNVMNLAANTCSLKDHIDPKKMKAAHKLFSDTFPDHEKLRHGVGHAAEFAAQAGKHGASVDKPPYISAPGGQELTVLNSLMGNKFFSTIEGVTCEIEISDQTLSKFRSVIVAYFEAFRRDGDKSGKIQ